MPVTGSRRWRPRWTLRLRLTALYGGLFLVAGTILLGITYGLVAHNIGNGPITVAARNAVVVSRPLSAGPLPVPPGLAATQNQVGGGALAATPRARLDFLLRAYKGKIDTTFRKLNAAQTAQIRAVQSKAVRQVQVQRHNDLQALLTRSGIALAIMALLSIALGWLVAGRALRPVRTMSARARGISERNLHERLALAGPNDELKELGDTFDELLGRLETAFESQRRFVSNASHELRTPITLERTLVEVALADPDASIESLQDTCKRVLAAGEQQERLIEALLTLARSQRGLESREQVDLSEVAADVLRGIDSGGVRLQPSLAAAETVGDLRLIERLVANLIDNALKYNLENGWVSIWTGVRDGLPTIEVANAGAVIESERVNELLEPFRRLNGDRSVPAEPAGQRGLGLGLSIVDAISDAHGARLRAAPRPDGGLSVEVRFPATGRRLSANGFGPLPDRVLGSPGQGPGSNL